MTPRQRMHAVLAGTGREAFPVVVPYLDIFLRDHWSEVTEVPWWSVRSGDIACNVRVLEDMQARLLLDWMPVYPGASRRWRDRHRVELREGAPVLVDDETGRTHPLREPPVGGVQTLVRQTSVLSEADVEAATPIASADHMLADGSFDLARAIVERFGDRLFTVGAISTPYWGLYFCFGFFDLMTNLVERPRLVERLLERLTQDRVELARAHAAIHCDGIWIEDCYASAELISPEQFRRFAAPYAAELVAEIRRLGMTSIYYYCGDPSGRLVDLLDMRPDALALEESKKGFVVDLSQVAEVAEGRVCLFGNFDAITLLERGTASEIRAEAARQVAGGGRWGRFVSSLGSPVTPSTPTARVREWADIAREHSCLAGDTRARERTPAPDPNKEGPCRRPAR